MTQTDLSHLSREDKLKAIELLQERKDRVEKNKLAYYEPYEYQRKFIEAGADNKQRLLMAANRIGKSDLAGYEIAIHATGLYPDDWDGLRFEEAPTIWIGGTSNDKVRDIMQEKLLGDPNNPSEFGKGFIPEKEIFKTVRKPGIPNAMSNIQVHHVSGGYSSVSFLSYESGKEAWMGSSLDLVVLDEEPPSEIYSQALRGIVDRGGNIMMTFTPENGITEIVHQFTTDIRKGQYLQNATWDDAPHITGEVKEQILAALPEHERKMRSQGIPALGSGLIYPVLEESITCEPFTIPDHFLRIAGIDFGYEHPAAWVSIAWDTEEDIMYVTDCIRMRHMTPDKQSFKIKQRGGRSIPCAWPADGTTSEKGTGLSLRQQYEGLYFLPESFTNPPDPITGKAGRSVEAGILHILERMSTGRFMIFSHLSELFEELRLYHRKDGKIVKKFDDAMDAMRYAAMSARNGERAKHSFKAYVPEDAYFMDGTVGY